MSAPGRDQLYRLLPALYRQIDEREGGPLRTLMAVLEGEFRHLEEDIGAMYDDWFIETCDLWVVPYIADQLGVRNLQDVEHIPSQRRLVANAIAYRRRKGTMAVLEKVVRDATGWYARGVEYARLVSFSQHTANAQPESGRTVDVDELQGASLDFLTRTVDINDSSTGDYNQNAVGFSLYRLRSYPINRSLARPVSGRPGCYTFDPLGRDMPLYNQPQPDTHASQCARPVNLPIPICQAELAADLREYRAQYGALQLSDQPVDSLYYGPDRSLYLDLPGESPVIKPSSVLSMDLSEWPAACKTLGDAVAAVDVELGRIAFIDPPRLSKSGDGSDQVRSFRLRKRLGSLVVNYNYGFSSEIGGGPYSRELWAPGEEGSFFKMYVAMGTGKPNLEAIRSGSEDFPDCVPSLQDALSLWEQAAKVSDQNLTGVIYILDNGLYEEELQIKLLPGGNLSIVADNGVRPVIGAGQPAIRVRVVESATGAGGHPGRQLRLNGLFLLGGLRIDPGEENDGLALTIEHCTLLKTSDGKSTFVPAPLLCDPASQNLELNIVSSILGPLCLPRSLNNVSVSGSIVDGGVGYAIAADPSGSASGPAVKLENTTIFGLVYTEKVNAARVIFGGSLRSHSEGSPDQIAYSYVPPGSTTWADKDHPSISREIPQPRFTSTRYGDPGYGQLCLDCSPSVRRTADGSEMGAFHDLCQVLAEDNLQMVLKEYLPVGLRARIHFIT